MDQRQHAIATLGQRVAVLSARMELVRAGLVDRSMSIAMMLLCSGTQYTTASSSVGDAEELLAQEAARKGWLETFSPALPPEYSVLVGTKPRLSAR